MDAETKSAIEICLRGVLAEHLPIEIRKAMDDAFELRGVAATTPEQRASLRKDIEFMREARIASQQTDEEAKEKIKDETFVRQMRIAKEAAALKIGNGILNLAILGLLVLVGLGAAITLKPGLFK